MHAVINESLCIGCTKCQKVCPMDAIVGARRMVHTVREDACHACGLCLPVCPAACIGWSVGQGTHRKAEVASPVPTVQAAPPPSLPQDVLAKVAAARAASRQKYEACGPLNQPKALRTKRAPKGA